MKKLLILSLLTLTVLLLLIRVISQFQPQKANFQTILIGSQRLHVETARSALELSKGLGGRDTIGSDGMLFILPLRIVPTFWMKDMRFGLDFVWIDNGIVAALTPNVLAEPGIADSSLKIYSPNLSATDVLELPLGDIAKRHISIGEAVSL